MTTQFLTLSMLFAALFGLVGCTTPPEDNPKSDGNTTPREQVNPNEPRKSKLWSELIVGTWKRDNTQSNPKAASDHRMGFTRDGFVTTSICGQDGAGVPYQQHSSEFYRLEGSTLRLLEFPTNGVPKPTFSDAAGPGLVLESATIVIDFPNEDTLTLTTTIRTKYGPEELELRVKGGLGSRKELAAEVFEDRLRGVYRRVKDK